MTYRIDNKFVTKEAYEAHVAAQNGSGPVSETETETKPRNISPLVAAQRRLAAANKVLKKSQAFWGAESKRVVPPTIEDAQAEYDAAAEELKALL